MTLGAPGPRLITAGAMGTEVPDKGSVPAKYTLAMLQHIVWWSWALRVKLCDLMPFRICWIHGMANTPLLDFDDPCWERAGWRR